MPQSIQIKKGSLSRGNRLLFFVTHFQFYWFHPNLIVRIGKGIDVQRSLPFHIKLIAISISIFLLFSRKYEYLQINLEYLYRNTRLYFHIILSIYEFNSSFKTSSTFENQLKCHVLKTALVISAKLDIQLHSLNDYCLVIKGATLIIDNIPQILLYNQ